MIRIEGIPVVAARLRAESRQNVDFGRERPAGVMKLYLVARHFSSVGVSPRIATRALQRSEGFREGRALQ